MSIIVFFIVFFISYMQDGSKQFAEDFLPEKVSSWHSASDDIATYSPDNLYDYINGGAELFLSYGFKKLFNRVYTAEGQPDLIIDVFDMGSDANAFGLYTHSREVIDSTFGQGSQYTEGLLLFWKDRFYISILCSPETPESKQAIFAAASFIDRAIKDSGKIPELVSSLPRKNLIEESIRFFRHHFWLNMHYYIAEDNLLLIDQNSQVVLAKYSQSEFNPVIVFIQYESKAKASDAQDNFVQSYSQDNDSDTVFQIEDGTWNGIKQDENRLLLVFNAADSNTVYQFIESIISGHKNE